MTLVTNPKEKVGFIVQKKLGFGGEYGNAEYGIGAYGYYDVRYGIYQIRHTPNGQRTVREKFYWPTQTMTPAKAASQAKWAAGMTAWSNLTTEQKNVYNERAKHLKMHGSNLYMREYMRS